MSAARDKAEERLSSDEPHLDVARNSRLAGIGWALLDLGDAIREGRAPLREPAPTGPGDDSDVEAGRCCPHCRQPLTDHNVRVWNAGYANGQRHATTP